ncbi:hypothetical protein HSBAA_13220 [Vreelandella sulfidaeris]|uniref:Uncharacterized protein n=1 Tax=Vreelandella sulfidaeris TaxID=115553 RepID=A0A455U212_9GAMM|nr:hypothetical protein HSBAA_13220 [Halomonas sulfidaeris]
MLLCTTQFVYKNCPLYNNTFHVSPGKGVAAMQYSANHRQTMEADIMEVWAERAQQQRAAYDAIKAYLG